MTASSNHYGQVKISLVEPLEVSVRASAGHHS